MKKKSFIVLAGLILIIFLTYKDGLAEVNIIKNPSFEQINNLKPEFWKTSVWDKESGRSEFLIGHEDAHGGNSFVTIINNKDNDARLLQRIKVRPDKIYRLSCWIKTRNVSYKNKGASISVNYRIETSRDIKGTSNIWKYTDMYIRTGKHMTQIEIALSLGGYYSINKGEASFDDISVKEVKTVPKNKTIINLEDSKDSSKVGETGGKGINHILLSYFAIFALVILFGLGGYLLNTYRRKTAKLSNFDIKKDSTNISED